MNVELLKETLKQRIVTVVFTKNDGSERTMNCTLQESFFPVVEQKTEPTKIKNLSAGESNSVLDLYILSFDINKNLTINATFKKEYIKNLSISDLLLTNHDLKKKLLDDYAFFIRYSGLNFKTIMTLFLNLTLFLILFRT